MWRKKRALGVLIALVGLASAPLASLAELPECIIDFEVGCPNDAAQCGATFSGGGGCIFEGLAFCYSTGLFSYKITQPSSPLTITLDDDLMSLRVFFVHQGVGASGTMRFFDALVGGNEVNAPGLVTNGDCLPAMQATQEIIFDTPVRRIEVTAAGGPLEAVWIDTFHVNPIELLGMPIPAVSQWGIVVMVGIILVAGTAAFRRRA